MNEWMRPSFASSGRKKNPLMQASSNNEIDLGTLFAGARACGNSLTLFVGKGRRPHVYEGRARARARARAKYVRHIGCI